MLYACGAAAVAPAVLHATPAIVQQLLLCLHTWVCQQVQPEPAPFQALPACAGVALLTLSSSSLTEYTGRNLRCSAMVLVLLNSLAASDFFMWELN